MGLATIPRSHGKGCHCNEERIRIELDGRPEDQVSLSGNQSIASKSSNVEQVDETGSLLVVSRVVEADALLREKRIWNRGIGA
jgi:hypothetical protein